MDSYFSATPEISNRIEDNDYKISQTVEVTKRYYGILVRDKDLLECLQDSLDDIKQDTISDLITDEIGSEVLRLLCIKILN